MSQLRTWHGVVLLAAIATAVGGCGRDDPAAEKKGPYAALDRQVFNVRAAERFLPFFWREDTDNDGSLDPGELEFLFGFPQSDRASWIDDSGRFTQEFRSTYKALQAALPTPSDPAEQKRRQLVVEELAQGRPTLVSSDLTQISEGEKTFLKHMLAAAELIERLYARQKGVFGMQADIPSDDRASQMMFYRNQSPFCEAPKTENIPECSARSEEAGTRLRLVSGGDSEGREVLLDARKAAEREGAHGPLQRRRCGRESPRTLPCSSVYGSVLPRDGRDRSRARARCEGAR